VLDGDSQIAAAALKGRPLASYVPQLIAALPSEVQVSGTTNITFTPFGAIREHEVNVATPEDGIAQSQVVRDVQLLGPRISTANAARQLARSTVTEAAAFERQAIEQSERIKQNISQRRGLIETALLASTGFEKVETREAWLAQFTRALEAYSPAQIPEFEPSSSRTVTESARMFVPHECFSPGTLVVTQTGSTAIEALKPGDRVLAQNPETGELAYQAVRGVTLRPAVPLVEIEAGGETIRATRGHPFWVNGQGWLMAKHLQAGQYLHTPDGPLKIERIGEQPAQEAYNLVVSDFATYFVGKQKILVHDNQPLQGTGVLVPGLAARDVKP